MSEAKENSGIVETSRTEFSFSLFDINFMENHSSNQ